MNPNPNPNPNQLLRHSRPQSLHQSWRLEVVGKLGWQIDSDGQTMDDLTDYCPDCVDRNLVANACSCWLLEFWGPLFHLNRFKKWKFCLLKIRKFLTKWLTKSAAKRKEKNPEKLNLLRRFCVLYLDDKKILKFCLFKNTLTINYSRYTSFMKEVIMFWAWNLDRYRFNSLNTLYSLKNSKLSYTFKWRKNVAYFVAFFILEVIGIRKVPLPSQHTTTFDVDTTLFGRQQRCYNVEPTSCAYWVPIYSDLFRTSSVYSIIPFSDYYWNFQCYLNKKQLFTTQMVGY